MQKPKKIKNIKMLCRQAKNIQNYEIRREKITLVIYHINKLVKTYE